MFDIFTDMYEKLSKTELAIIASGIVAGTGIGYWFGSSDDDSSRNQDAQIASLQSQIQELQKQLNNKPKDAKE